MKRLLQFAALALVALLAAQPALAGTSCNMGEPDKAPCAPGCGMQMSEMGADCQMHQQAVGPFCDQTCCRDGLPAGLAQLAGGDKQRPQRADLSYLVSPVGMANEGTASKAPPPLPLASTSPPRYILFQVFRI